MFQKKTVRAFSIVAIILSVIGLLLSINGTLLTTGLTMNFLLGIFSWSFLLWASVIGYQLCTSYTLYEDEYKIIGIRIYLIILVFVLFFFVGLILGFVLSILLLSKLWSLKSNYDDWEERNPTESDVSAIMDDKEE